jgi:hypothetical protein
MVPARCTARRCGAGVRARAGTIGIGARHGAGKQGWQAASGMGGAVPACAGRRPGAGPAGPDRGRLPGRGRDRARGPPGLAGVAPDGADQGGQPPVRRSPHGHDHGPVDRLPPARRDGAGGRLRGPFRARRRARRPVQAALRDRPDCRELRALCIGPGHQPQGCSGGGTHRHRPRHLALPQRPAGPCRGQRSRADPVLGRLRRHWPEDQGGHRRLPDGACARHEGHRHPHRHPAGRGFVLRQAISGAGHLAALRACLRAGPAGAAAQARRTRRRLVERMVRGLQARHYRHADERRPGWPGT